MVEPILAGEYPLGEVPEDDIDFVKDRIGVGPEVLETCSECLRSYYGGKVAAEGHM